MNAELGNAHKLTDARTAALVVLNTLETQRKTLDRILDDLTDSGVFFPRRDRGFFNALVFGVLRRRGYLDHIIKHFSKTRFAHIQPNVLNILRLGLFQIIFLSRVPVSAAVNTSVELSKPGAPPWVVSYVNAVLRRAARDYHAVPFPDVEKEPVAALATIESFPKWLIDRWLKRMGIEETRAMCRSINTIPPVTVRTNSLKCGRDELLKALKPDVEKIRKTDYSPDGLSFAGPGRAISHMKAFGDGWFQVQDEAAQLVTAFLGPQPGETVLDACAGLGGKTGHMAQQMKNKGKIIALDRNETKLSKLESEMRRLGVTMVSTRIQDFDYRPNADSLGLFDRVLLDAPCSGLGVLRRNPDKKWLLARKDMVRQQQKQKKFLNHLAHLVKPSGILLYAVCSTEPEENMPVIRAFLDKHGEFAIEKCSGDLSAKASFLLDKDGGLTTCPHLNNMDGFFSIRLRKKP